MKKITIIIFFIPLINFGQWVQIGNDIDGEAVSDNFGGTLCLNASGNIIAIGGLNNDGNGIDSGHVRILENINGVWIQIGNDIDGEGVVDNCGSSVDLNEQGNIVAIGAYRNDGNGSNSGHVRIFENIDSVWTQIGNDIDGEAAYDQSGWSISLNSNGNIIAIGAITNDGGGSNSGHVRVFQNNAGNWVQVGNDIDGSIGDNFGFSVCLNSTGNIVAIASKNNGSIFGSGYVKIFENNSGNWSQIGNTFYGVQADDHFGYSVSLNNQGNIIAIGSPRINGNGLYSGQVTIFENILGNWLQIGSDINAEASADRFGNSVSLNAIGNIVAIGAPWNDGNGSQSGHVRIFENISNNWTQIGSDVDGEASDDFFGNSVCLNAIGDIVSVGAPGNDGNGSLSGHVRIFENLTLSLENTLDTSLSLRVYPNPSSDYLEISGQIVNNLYYIYDNMGRLLEKSSIQNNKIKIEHLINGVYFLKISSYKFIKFIKK